MFSTGNKELKVVSKHKCKQGFPIPTGLGLGLAHARNYHCIIMLHMLAHACN